MEPKNTTNKNTSIIIGAIVVLAIIAAVVFADKKSSDTSIPAPVSSDTSTAPVDSTTPAAQAPAVSATGSTSTSTYKDGTYSATGSYISPGGPDHVGVTLTLKDDIITDITVTPEPGDNTSKKYQGIFAANYKPLVIGKDISTVHLTKVSGSSLTSGGFNDALSQIEAQAQA